MASLSWAHLHSQEADLLRTRVEKERILTLRRQYARRASRLQAGDPQLPTPPPLPDEITPDDHPATLCPSSLFINDGSLCKFKHRQALESFYVCKREKIILELANLESPHLLKRRLQVAFAEAKDPGASAFLHIQGPSHTMNSSNFRWAIADRLLCLPSFSSNFDVLKCPSCSDSFTHLPSCLDHAENCRSFASRRHHCLGRSLQSALGTEAVKMIREGDTHRGSHRCYISENRRLDGVLLDFGSGNRPDKAVDLTVVNLRARSRLEQDMYSHPDVFIETQLGKVEWHKRRESEKLASSVGLGFLPLAISSRGALGDGFVSLFSTLSRFERVARAYSPSRPWSLPSAAAHVRSKISITLNSLAASQRARCLPVRSL